MCLLDYANHDYHWKCVIFCTNSSTCHGLYWLTSYLMVPKPRSRKERDFIHLPSTQRQVQDQRKRKLFSFGHWKKCRKWSTWLLASRRAITLWLSPCPWNYSSASLFLKVISTVTPSLRHGKRFEAPLSIKTVNIEEKLSWCYGMWFLDICKLEAL